MRDRFLSVEPGALETRHFARHARGIVVGDGGFQTAERMPAPRLGRRIGEIDENLAAAILNPIGPHRIAADQHLARRQVEFPLVPGAGPHAARAQTAFAQGIPFMRTTIGDGEQAPLGGDQQNLLAVAAHELAPLRPKVAMRYACRSEHGASISAGRGQKTLKRDAEYHKTQFLKRAGVIKKTKAARIGGLASAVGSQLIWVAGPHAACACAAACGNGESPRPARGRASRTVSRNGPSASSRGRCPRVASSFSAPSAPGRCCYRGRQSAKAAPSAQDFIQGAGTYQTGHTLSTPVDAPPELFQPYGCKDVFVPKEDRFLELIRLDGALLDALADDPRAIYRGPWSNAPVAAEYLGLIASRTRALS